MSKRGNLTLHISLTIFRPKEYTSVSPLVFALKQPGVRSGLGSVCPSLLAGSTCRAGEKAARATGSGLTGGPPSGLDPGWPDAGGCSPYRESGAAPAAGSPVARPPLCRRFSVGCAGGVGELRRARSASAGRKLPARGTSIFLHKQLAGNKHLNPRLGKLTVRGAPRTGAGKGGGLGGKRVEEKMRGSESRGWVGCVQGGAPTRTPRVQRRLSYQSQGSSLGR